MQVQGGRLGIGVVVLPTAPTARIALSILGILIARLLGSVFASACPGHLVERAALIGALAEGDGEYAPKPVNGVRALCLNSPGKGFLPKFDYAASVPLQRLQPYIRKRRQLE